MDKSKKKHVEEQIANQTLDTITITEKILARLNEFDKRMDAGFADISERLDKIDGKLDGICGKVEKLASQLEK